MPCFGIYSTQVTYTIGTLPYDTLAEWAAEWDTIGDPQGASGFLYDIAAGTAGETYRLHAADTDAGSDFTGKFSLATDLTEGVGLHQYKRLLHMQLFVRRDAGTTMDVAVVEDRAAYWRHVGSEEIPNATATDSGDMVILDFPTDKRARHFDIRVSSGDGDFRVLGMTFDFDMDGAA